MGRTSAHADGRARYPRAVVVPFAVPDEGRVEPEALHHLAEAVAPEHGDDVPQSVEVAKRGDHRGHGAAGARHSIATGTL